MTQGQAFDRAVNQFPGFEISCSSNIRTNGNDTMSIIVFDCDGRSCLGLGFNWEDAYFSLLADYQNRNEGI